MIQNWVIFLTKERLCDFLHALPFFGTLTDADWQMLMESEHVSCQAFTSGESISESLHRAPAIAVLLSGNASVHNAEGDPTCLRLLTRGSVFGVASLFAPSADPISTVRATTSCEVAFLGAALVTQWITQNADFSMYYIRFLCDRIRFLNGRITAFTASSATEKLRNHLYELCAGRYPVTLVLNAARLATMLGMGRASLYRAFDALEQAGHIVKNGKSVTVLSL